MADLRDSPNPLDPPFDDCGVCGEVFNSGGEWCGPCWERHAADDGSCACVLCC